MSKFTDNVIAITNNIPKGNVVNYGQIALMAGIPRGAIMVGQILHNSGENTPWWRVINSKGRISTTCMEHTAPMQRKLLEEDGITVSDKFQVDIEKYRWRPNPTELKKFKLSEKYITQIIDKFGI
jgi:methylated-DNA-protein-cysteine methyltransferase related protein